MYEPTDSPPSRDEFMALPAVEIARWVAELGLPRVGVFVPDGNRRLVLATTDLAEGTDGFFDRVAHLQTSKGLETLKVFFSHGLPILITPVFSRSALSRESGYRRLTALKTLEIILTGQAWRDFYAEHKVRVRVYGDPAILPELGYEQVAPWIQDVQRVTEAHDAHTLLFGIGGETRAGQAAAVAAIRFFRQYGREASTDELIESLYGELIPPVDYMIVTSKLAGLAAAPDLITDANTQIYFLAAPGVASLNEHTLRAILYDLMYMRENRVTTGFYKLKAEQRKQLQAWYREQVRTTIGLGDRIGPIWIPVQSRE